MAGVGDERKLFSVTFSGPRLRNSKSRYLEASLFSQNTGHCLASSTVNALLAGIVRCFESFSGESWFPLSEKSNEKKCITPYKT